MNQAPKSSLSLRHVALFARNFSACEYFYTQLLGLKIVWRPDADNLYLSNGDDNLALHRAESARNYDGPQRLDHLGFFLATKEAVDEWCDYLTQKEIIIITKPKDHRDGTRSFYCQDPDGNVVQFIYYPLS